jgi:hypothetical protein
MLGFIFLALQIKYNKKLLSLLLILITILGLSVLCLLYYFMHPKSGKMGLLSSKRNRITINSYYIDGGATTGDIVRICKYINDRETILDSYSGFNNVKSIDWLNDSTAKVILSKYSNKDSIVILEIK